MITLGDLDLESHTILCNVFFSGSKVSLTLLELYMERVLGKIIIYLLRVSTEKL